MTKNKNKSNAAKNIEPTVLVQDQAVTGTENESKTQEVQTTNAEGKGEQPGGEQTENIQHSKLDSENKTEGTGTEKGGEAGGEVAKKAEPKSKTDQRAKIAEGVFAKNHRTSVLFFTSDMTPFFEKSDAIKHGNGLSDKTIVTVNKE